MPDLSTTDTSVAADRDRVVIDPDTGTRRRIFAGTSVPKALWDLDDAPDETTTKRVAAPDRDKAQRSANKTK